jgi:hypothetical protein
MSRFVIGALAGVSLILSAQLAISQALPPVPRLIAHDCEGAGGDLWAMEESDFPNGCGMIEENR